MADKKAKLASARRVFDVYWGATKGYPWSFALVVIGTIGIQIADLVSPWFLRTFFNTLATTAPSPEMARHLLVTVGIIGAIAVTAWAFRRIQSRCIMYLETHVMTELLTSAYGYLMGHSYNFFVSRFGGALTHRVSRFMKVYESLTDAIMLQFFPTTLFVVGAIVVLSIQHPLLGLALTAWAALFMAFQVWVTQLRHPLRAERAEAESQNTAALADSISNQATVMLFSGRAHEQGIVRKAAEKWRAATARVWYADDWIWAAMGLFMIAINVGMLYIATVLWGKGMLTIGDFVLIQSYLLSTFDRLYGINRELRRFYEGLADAQEMVAILEMPHEVRDKRNAKKLKVSAGEIWFDDVTFYFNDGTDVLGDFNLKIQGGEKIALVGPSGAGKSTVTKLLLRLYDVKKGEIKIDGQPIASVTQDSLRDAIGFVPQEPILFHRTLMENIRYGRHDATDEEVIAAAKKAHCHEFIARLPEGYDTFVGERGIKLSGGERQRVAIARAILKDAPILVLDEATSSLDSESEALIQDALETLMEGKTVLVIAHRLSTIMKMDRIVVIEKGGIVAQGTHLELVNQEGLYRKLWSIQAGGFIGDGHAPKGEDEADTDALDEDLEEELAEDKERQ